MVVYVLICLTFLFFFFNDTATTEIYTLSLHDALPISTLPRRTSAITWRACARQDSCGSVPRARAGCCRCARRTWKPGFRGCSRRCSRALGSGQAVPRGDREIDAGFKPAESGGNGPPVRL